jgi:hypothetical protein
MIRRVFIALLALSAVVMSLFVDNAASASLEDDTRNTASTSYTVSFQTVDRGLY